MLLTASKMAACSIAKLRVECIVGDWAPGVRTISSRVLFHSMTGFTDGDAEAECSSLLVAVVLAKPVIELKKPAHRSAKAKILFAIKFTSPIGFSENARPWPGPPTAVAVESHAMETEKGGLYSNSVRASTTRMLTVLPVMAARWCH
jgi:hypothetical protein